MSEPLVVNSEQVHIEGQSHSIVQEKSYAFALRVFHLYQHLSKEKKAFVLAKQVLRCGTSVGVNVKEALAGLARRDFAAKMSIAYKEAQETSYWLQSLKDANCLDEGAFRSMQEDCEELLRLLHAIVYTARPA
jgi:four helix bundle protein